MERKIPFVEGEIYHVYARGVEKRVVLETDQDYQRFQLLLYLCNGSKAVNMRDLLAQYKGVPFVELFEDEDPGERLVNILAYTLLPNHLHLLIKERASGGISKFMLKLMTAYAMYFNTLHDRSGPLFTRPFRSQHIDTDDYLRWVLAYVLLNSLSLYQKDWKLGIHDIRGANDFIRSYAYSSFVDYEDLRAASKIISTDERLPASLSNIDELLSIFTKGNPL